MLIFVVEYAGEDYVSNVCKSIEEIARHYVDTQELKSPYREETYNKIVEEVKLWNDFEFIDDISLCLDFENSTSMLISVYDTDKLK